MSDLPMTVPEGHESSKYLELAICLPSSWKVDTESFKDEKNYWPIRLLKQMARMPHDYKTFLAIDHSIANTQDYLPYAENTKLCATLIGFSRFIMDAGFYKLKTKDKDINFYFVIPLYKEEVEFKVKNGTAALYEEIEKRKIIVEIVDPQRQNAIL